MPHLPSIIVMKSKLLFKIKITAFYQVKVYSTFKGNYELNAVEIDKNKNVGLTSLIKNCTSVFEAQSKFLKNASWFRSSNANILLTDNARNFDASIPLSTIFHNS